mmetsp:Transcript_10616/g.27533  ORF Transcript_10616/g.27533 Transcript_10616/m.27533 type:complete len:81 (+) Transcript_10616:479-721(+)
MRILASTLPQYGIILYEAISVLARTYDVDLRAHFFGWHSVGVCVCAAAFLVQFELTCTAQRAIKAAGFFDERNLQPKAPS